jgi:hypothetical protein
VLIFAAIGRHSHDEADGLAGILTTAWPFLIGTAAGWLAMSAVLRRTPHTIREAVPIWVTTVAVGMVLRHASGRGTPVSFVIVATLFLGLFLLGWRALIALWQKRNRPAPIAP